MTEALRWNPLEKSHRFKSCFGKAINCVLMKLLDRFRKRKKWYEAEEATVNGGRFKEYVELGQSYFMKGLWDKAVEQFERALEIKPGDSGVHFKMSYAFLHMGMEDKSLAEYRKAWEPYARNKIVSRLIEAHEESTGSSYRRDPSPLERGYYRDLFPIERGYSEDPNQFESWLNKQGLFGFEYKSTPDIECYSFVLENLNSGDVVLDVGAGDLRLDVLMAEKVKKVYAIEVNPILVARALQIIGYDLPRNLIVICANIFDIEPPSDANVAVILMRHCTRQKEMLKKFRKLKVISNFDGELRIKAKET